jgi:hypothetical protein
MTAVLTRPAEPAAAVEPSPLPESRLAAGKLTVLAAHAGRAVRKSLAVLLFWWNPANCKAICRPA